MLSFLLFFKAWIQQTDCYYSSMLKNRMVQLQKFKRRTTEIGSKLNTAKTPLIIQSKNDQFTQLKELIKELNYRTQQLRDIRQDYRKIKNYNREKQINGRVDEILKENRGHLKKMEQSVKTLNTKIFKEDQSDGDITKKAMCVDLTKKSKIAIQEFKIQEQKITNAMRQTIRRQATIIQGQISQKQLEELVYNPNKGQQLLTQKLLDSPSIQLQNTVSDILDKYRDIRKLEKSIHQCMDLLQQLALLVVLQGEQIDNIEATLQQAKNYVEEAQVSIRNAKQSHKSSRKYIFCIVLLLILVIGVIAIPILITQLKK